MRASQIGRGGGNEEYGSVCPGANKETQRLTEEQMSRGGVGAHKKRSGNGRASILEQNIREEKYDCLLQCVKLQQNLLGRNELTLSKISFLENL